MKRNKSTKIECDPTKIINKSLNRFFKRPFVLTSSFSIRDQIKLSLRERTTVLKAAIM